MTAEERLDKIEHLTAGWIVQSKKEHEENRHLWRETQQQIQDLNRETHDKIQSLAVLMESHSQKLHDAMEVHARQLREEMAGRDRVTDGRIQEMVSAIGQFIDKASELTTNLTNRTLPHKDISEKPL